ncbi:MAG: hypothetical protein J3T61_05965 [Candidatus Brocadiales bacterium]|nr:hypothetical protein [Candidatus Bathyanammoxibius sp.]
MKILSPILLLLLTFTLAQETATEQQRRASVTEDTKTVVATGMGVDREAALKQALRSAVEQAIGVFLKTETVVENFQLIHDEILTHSRGYVQSFDIINEGQADGLYSMSLSAVVIVKELELALVELRLYTRPIEGETLFAKAFTQISETRDAVSLYQDLRNDYPRNCVKVVFGEPKIESGISDLVTIRIPYTFEWQEGYITKLIEVLEETSVAIAQSKKENEKFGDRFWKEGNSRISILDATKSTDIYYWVNELAARELIVGSVPQRFELFVALEDQNGTILKSKSYHVGERLFFFSQHYRGISIGYHLKEDVVHMVEFELPVDDLPKITAVSGYVFEK